MRCTQGVFSGVAPVQDRSSVRIQLYVDDLAMVLSGTRRQRDRHIAKVVLIWRLLGFRVAFHKALRGANVRWIGCTLSASRSEIWVTVSADKILELKVQTANMLRDNVVSVKILRDYGGLASHVASVIYVWRPFLSEMWAAVQKHRGRIFSCTSQLYLDQAD